MFNPDTIVLLPTVLDELCENVSTLEFSTRTTVASRLLEVATSGERSIDHLKDIGRDALNSTPTMWR